MSAKKKILGVAALAAVAVGGAAGPAAADSGPRLDDLAPHSTDDVTQLVGVNGDTVVTDLVNVNAPVNIPAVGSKTGPQQIDNEHSSAQLDAPFNDLDVTRLHKHVVQGLPL